ncbi:hypothetical protein HanRHA438_Chr09g0420921 [Helianthus annuus]|nr:hypothetical protein HanRHA438_Chr09g0420921 [Helianthus annuus]
MDHISWLRPKKSLEKSPIDESSGESMSSYSDRFSGDQRMEAECIRVNLR